MKKICILLFAFTLFQWSCGSSGGLGSGWQFLGDQSVDYIIDHDELTVSNVNDEFRKVRLRVTEGPLHILNMRIHFDNGGVQNVSMNSVIRAGEQSKSIALEGGMRHINKIGFWYNTVGFLKGKAKVGVWASK